jgi:hypothetical protein
MAVITQAPHLATKRPEKQPEADWGDWKFSKRSLKLLDAWEFKKDGFTVGKQETYLGGHAGPDEGLTSPRVGSPYLKEHPWFAGNPKWWLPVSRHSN